MITALIPYFAGWSSAAHSNLSKRREWLDLTVESLQGFADWVVVGGCEELYPSLPGDRFTRFQGDPIHLPARMFRWFQEPQSSHWIPEDTEYIYVTEADQVLTIDASVLEYVTDDTYLVPHRVEHGRLSNGPPHGTDTYEPHGLIEKFGGAFLCTKSLFDKIEFTDSPLSPVEHSTGFEISYVGDCRKTSDVSRFWVDHLSAVPAPS